jgi:hypothetical protein
MGPDKSAGAAYGGSYGVDTNWYSDSGATDHVTSELEKLQVRDRYNGNEQIDMASGTGMDIRHVGHSVFHTPTHDLHLKNILHVPKPSKSLLSTSRLTRDNHAFVEYWPSIFLSTIRTRGKSCFKVDVWMVSTLCRLHHLHPLVGKLMVSSSQLPCFGIGA